MAKHILDSNWTKFENVSIIEDIGSRCSRCKESHVSLRQLQQQILGDTLGGKRRKIPSVCRATLKIEEALQMQKALILLDDIVEPGQLVALLGTRNINKQSKVIITTRQNSIIRWLESRSWWCQEYKVKLLDVDESLKLLSLHAFR
ncbi:TMV resistance protein N-like protein, partial [Tanacetum coccineum]